MKYVKFLGAAISACCLATMSAAPAFADLLDDMTKAKKIRISTDLAIPPSGMMDSSMKPTGSDVEVAQLLAKDWGLELEFVQTTGATRIPNVLTGKADIIISTLSVTAERAKVIDFTKRYATLQSDIGCLKSLNVKDWPDLKDKTVGVARGTTQDTMLSNMKDKELKIARYDDDATGVTAAVSGQVDCVGTSATIINQIGVKNPARIFEPKIPLASFDLAIGLKKGEQRLMDKLNAWVTENVKNGKLNAIYKKFHGVELPPDMRG
ncbi:transporter substrate-binding domain-containing protein [Bradyrhizobium sp. 190]|uniref:transporter substrate-binding domain-containing protein n=1 Tax=Bradyrhizobium sp. 190 TaxID=2782658 RepID=UPI001FFC26AB|nr:transporter substrate-binding domain-containing protein [Bradyrhizobium sp. 190]MCK1515012.1 transporter substrate-binding domain-containing protein [Bradyrhizobium sp. 190]